MCRAHLSFSKVYAGGTSDTVTPNKGGGFSLQTILQPLQAAYAIQENISLTSRFSDRCDQVSAIDCSS